LTPQKPSGFRSDAFSHHWATTLSGKPRRDRRPIGTPRPSHDEKRGRTLGGGPGTTAGAAGDGSAAVKAMACTGAAGVGAATWGAAAVHDKVLTVIAPLGEIGDVDPPHLRLGMAHRGGALGVEEGLPPGQLRHPVRQLAPRPVERRGRLLAPPTTEGARRGDRHHGCGTAAFWQNGRPAGCVARHPRRDGD